MSPMPTDRGVRRLSRNDANDVEPSDQFPAWSPDGRLIAFESLRSGSWHIWLMRSDGSGARRLTRDGRGGYSPQWAPDGKRIVYTTLWNQSSLGIVDLAGHTRA